MGVSVVYHHVINGAEIAKKNKLPDRVIDFIRTHHGTSYVRYFYNKQMEITTEFAPSDFMYNGPKPFSKETAILMMCDSVEAASKSLRTPDYKKINEFVNQLIDKQMISGQFQFSNITLMEIEQVKSEALTWCIGRGHRSGRTAYQFIIHLAGKLNIALKLHTNQ